MGAADTKLHCIRVTWTAEPRAEAAHGAFCHAAQPQAFAMPTMNGRRCAIPAVPSVKHMTLGNLQNKPSETVLAARSRKRGCQVSACCCVKVLAVDSAGSLRRTLTVCGCCRAIGGCSCTHPRSSSTACTSPAGSDALGSNMTLHSLQRNGRHRGPGWASTD